MDTVILKDGFNGGKEVFNAEPLAIDGKVAKVCVSGKPWLIKHVLVSELQKAIQEQSK